MNETPASENRLPEHPHSDWEDDWYDDDEPPGCDHEWLDRPESDTHECLVCGIEGNGPPPCVTPPA